MTTISHLHSRRIGIAVNGDHLNPKTLQLDSDLFTRPPLPQSSALHIDRKRGTD